MFSKKDETTMQGQIERMAKVGEVDFHHSEFLDDSFTAKLKMDKGYGSVSKIECQSKRSHADAVAKLFKQFTARV